MKKKKEKGKKNEKPGTEFPKCINWLFFAGGKRKKKR